MRKKSPPQRTEKNPKAAEDAGRETGELGGQKHRNTSGHCPGTPCWRDQLEQDIFFRSRANGQEPGQQDQARPWVNRDEETDPPGVGGLAALLRNLGGTQANYLGCPLFDRK
jgi:hypothetical protein